MRVRPRGLLEQAGGYPIAVLLLAALALNLAGPAGAQVVTRTASTQSVAVVPFENLTKLPPETFPALGDEAAAAVSVELRDRLLLDVLPAADVNLAMRDLGLTGPLSDAELVRLATQLEVVLLVAGQVRAAEIISSPEGRYGQVTLAVRLFDRIAGADVNGALVTAKGPASPDASDDVLVGKALHEAAFQAVQEMRSRPAITAMVLWSRDNLLFLNVGSRAGVMPGMKMVAVRNNIRIGLVQITDSDALGSYATVIEGPPLRTGDHLRAIYELPKGVKPTFAERVEKKKTRFEHLAFAAAALLGVADLGSTTRELLEGNEAMPAFTASDLANQMDLGYNYPGSFVGVTLITWQPYSGTEAKRIAAYEISSDAGIVDIVVPGPANYLVWRGPASYPGGYMEAVIELASDTTGTVAYSSEFITEEDPANAKVGVVTESDDYGITQITYDWIPYGPKAGVPYVYYVKPIVLTQELVDPQTFTYEWRLTYWNEYSSPNNYVVTVGPPFASNALVTGSTATFFFYSPIGADEAIIQIARDPYNDFPPGQTYQQTIPGTWTGNDELALQSVRVNLANVPGTGNIFWWRVGARARASATKPRPWPLDRYNDYNWVWSTRERLVLMGPSAERASEVHRQRDALARARVPESRTLPRAPRDRVLRSQ